jgi:hypothetical protein
MALPKNEADPAEWQACILVEEANRSCKAKPLFALGGVMDNSFLKEHAARCRSLAGNADEFTKRRLLDLAAKYDDRLLSQPSRASRVIKLPVNLPHAPSELL